MSTSQDNATQIIATLFQLANLSFGFERASVTRNSKQDIIFQTVRDLPGTPGQTVLIDLVLQNQGRSWFIDQFKITLQQPDTDKPLLKIKILDPNVFMTNHDASLGGSGPNHWDIETVDDLLAFFDTYSAAARQIYAVQVFAPAR